MVFKNIVLSALLISTTLLSEESLNNSPNSSSQNLFQSDKTHFWLNYGAGISNSGFYHGGSLNLNRSLFLSRLLFSTMSHTEHYTSGSAYSDDTKRIHFYTVALSGGVGFSYRALYWGITVGPSFSWGEVTRQEDISEFEWYQTIESVTVPGGYGGTYILFAPHPRFGFGVDGSVILNSADSKAGVLATVNFGKFDEAITVRNVLRDRRQMKKERRTGIKESSTLSKDLFGLGWGYFFWGEKMGVATAWDHRIGTGFLSLGADLSLWFNDTGTVYIEQYSKDPPQYIGYEEQFSRTTHMPIRFRFGFHPLQLPAPQEKWRVSSVLDPYFVMRIGQDFEWTTTTTNGETTKEFQLGEGIFDGGGFWNIDSWGTVAVGIRWYFHPHWGVWGEFDWYRGIIGGTFQL